MNRRLALTFGLGVLFGARVAAAQEVTIGYQGLPYKATGERNTGISLGEGVLMHMGAGAEAGWDSNVFYGSSNSALPLASSSLLRFTGFAEVTNASRNPTVALPGLVYDARVGMIYRRYMSDDPAVVRFRNAFMPSAGLSLSGSSGPWAFQLVDAFVRIEDPPYLAAGAGPIARDNNTASAQAMWSPGGGRLMTTLRYSNIIDIFETGSGFEYGSNLTNQMLLDVAWKWLPKTALFVQAVQGWVTYLNSAAGSTGSDPTVQAKVDSYPLHAIVGLRGLITTKMSALLALGYGNAFYSSGATTQGILGSTYIDAQVLFNPTMLSRIVAGYHQDFTNSVISAFYYDYSVYASYIQQLWGRFAVDLSGRFSHRSYRGLLFDPTRSRTDNVVLVGVTLDYFLRNWAYLGAGYSMSGDFSDYTLPMSNAPVDYLKHQVFARLGVTY
jgi:hypothetical protein